jgi:outer membrane usher protein
LTKFFIFFLIFCSSLSGFAQFPVSGELFQKSYEAQVPMQVADRDFGLVRIQLKSERIVSIEKKSLLEILKQSVKEKKWRDLESKAPWIPTNEINLPIVFDPINAIVKLDLPIEDLAGQDLTVTDNAQQRYGQQSLMPAPFGGAINYRLEKGLGADSLGGESFTGFFDTFVNVNGFVIESQLNYTEDQTSSAQGWFRGDTRVIKDFQSKRVRAEAGDIYPTSFGFMNASPIGGVQIARNFTLDPYRIPFPQGQGSFTLRTRSQVRTFVNGVLIKDEILPAGNYDLRDVPLINGLNTVIVETTDELGAKQIFEFRLPTSVGLLKEGEWNFSLSHGKPFRDIELKREYTESPLSSGYVQYGLTQAFSLGGYAQSQDDFLLTGGEFGYATTFGNLFLGTVMSRKDETSAGGGSLTWQLQNLGSKLFDTYNLTLRHERFGDGFQNQNLGLPANLKAQWQSNITLPVRELFTASLGLTYGEVRDQSLENRHGFDAAINIRAFRNLNVNFFVARTRDEFKRYNDVAYAFFTWTFDSANHFVSGFHDIENKSTRLTAVKDNANRLYDPRITAVVDEGEQRDGAEIDAFIPTPMADIGGRVTAARFSGQSDTEFRGVARISSALVFAYSDGDFGLGFSRPVPNSFVLFKPSEELKDQKIGLRSTSPFAEGESGPLGEITFTNILPYQFREIQLDPTSLELGTSLEQERFVVYPTYRSAHLINLKDRGVVMISGKLNDKKGKPLSLLVGEIGGRPFFTSRDGSFFIDGLESGEYELKIDKYDSVKININNKSRGIKALGTIVLQESLE